VFHVNGVNFIGQAWRPPYSYFFSKYAHSYGGWATWRRAWSHFDATMSAWPQMIRGGRFEAICRDPYERRYWRQMLADLTGADTDPWDYRWMLTVWSLGKLAVYPGQNLVSNIGYGHPEAVHTKFWEATSELPLGELGELRHPPEVCQSALGDHYDFDRAYAGWVTKRRDGLRGILSLLRAKLRYLLPAPPYYPPADPCLAVRISPPGAPDPDRS
jgi:hypothetical protein